MPNMETEYPLRFIHHRSEHATVHKARRSDLKALRIVFETNFAGGFMKGKIGVKAVRIVRSATVAGGPVPVPRVSAGLHNLGFRGHDAGWLSLGEQATLSRP